MVSFAVARQFPNGLRAGVGLAWRPRIIRGLNNEREYLNSQLLADEWATFRNRESQYLSASLNLDYTFRRRKRLRPYLGATLQSNFYNDRKETLYLHERQTGQQETVFQLLYPTVRGDFGKLRVLPRVGFQYSLTDRLSIGTEIVPGIDVGGRFRW